MDQRLRYFVVALAAVAIAGILPAAPAAAQNVNVTLVANHRHVDFGRSLVLTGKVSDPAAAGQQIEILNDAGRLVAGATMDATGAFQTRFWPRKRTVMRASWQDVTSRAVTVNVKPLVDVALGATNLFDRAKVRGEVRPVIEGQKADLKLKQNGVTIATRSVTLTSNPRFKTSFPIRTPGRYRVAVHIDGAEHLSARALSGSSTTEVRSLSSGSSGRLVKALERRLIRLGYYLPGADRIYDNKTHDAVIAFHKVHRMARSGAVGDATWRALVEPVVPKPRVKRGYHIEVDQTRQVLFVVKRGKVRWILHTSTGAGSATRDGSFTVHRKLAGTSGNGLYMPSYFDGLRAIHGWPEVPTYNASHGCARVPMWSATWIYSMADIGTRVIVYH